MNEPDRELAAGAAVLCALGELNERQRYIFVSKRVHGQTYQAIADHFGISRERVRQLLTEAERRLAHELAAWRDELVAA